MRRAIFVTTAAALLAGSLVPLSSAASAAPGDGIAPSTGSSEVSVGGGDGLSGPASRAQVGYVGHLALRPDGTVLVVASGTLLRVDPASDRVSVVEQVDAEQEHGAVDVAMLGTTTYLLTPWGLDRIDGDGERTRLWTGRGNAVDVGADGVAWIATDYTVTRVLPDGTATAVVGTNVMDAADIAVSDSGSTAYVLDHAPQRHGIYEVTAAGVGARVAGTGYRDDSLRDGQPATAASMESVQGISLDAGTITVSSGEYQLLATFPIGGVISVRSTGRYGAGVDTVGGTTVATQGPTGDSVVRLTSAGASRRILGVDPDQPWSPDGVLAADAYMGALRGAAPIDDTRLVFVTAGGMVREVGADGRLRTRAVLPPITTRGKVAAAPDGTAYVINDSGRVVRVPAIGPALVLPIVATATDVEVLPDGRLAIADSAPARILLAQADGTGVTVLTGLTAAPNDLGVDDTSILVADDGLRRVKLDGSVDTLLSGGRPTAALRARDGIWTGQLHSPDTSAMVLQPGGGLGALRAVYDTGRQAQAVGGGDVLVTRDNSVLRVTNGAVAPEQAGPAATATPGEGRVTLRTGEPNTAQGIFIRAKRGTEPPHDMWDGEMAGTSNTVFRIGGELVVPGEQWTFAVFTSFYSEAAPNTVVASWTTPAVVTAAAGPDATPPPLPTEPRLYTDHEQIRLTYNDPSAWQDQAALDFDRTVVRYSVGSTPPASPTEGTGLDTGDGAGHDVSVQNPVRGQDYGLSIFSLDFRGNFSRWSTVTRLDYQPPGAVTDVAVTPSYRSARVRFAEPTDADYRGVAFTIAAGEGVPTPPSDDAFFTTSEVAPGGLVMDTTYTIALWTRDWAGNVSAPVTRSFRTLLDATPPGPVTGLTAQGGSYSITANWTNPTDSDFTGPVAELVDPTTGTASPCLILNSSKTSCTWRLKGDASRTVRVRAKDVNGNLSAPTEATATTLPDSNGTPSIPEPVTWSADNPTTITVRFPKPTYVDLAAQWYVLRPSGDPTASPLATDTLSSWTSTIAKSISLPDPSQAYDLYLYVSDLNGNRGEKVLTGVHGGPDPAGRPSMPGNVRVTAPFDNTIKVTWSTGEWSAPISEWVATATSPDGSMVRTVSVPGTATNLGIGDLPGRQSWSVRLHGLNELGSGTPSLAQSVLVGDATAPAPVTVLASAPVYDTATLHWTNPAAFDLAKVVVLRRDRTSGAVATLYSGIGTTARSTSLVAGRSYTYEVRSYDTLGNVSLPATLTTTQSAPTLSVASTLRYGSTVRASGVLSLSGKALTGRTVGLFAQRVGTTTWSRMASTTTSSTGTFAFAAKPTVNMRYRVGYAGAGTAGGAYSPIRTVTVAPITRISANRTSLHLGGSVTLSTNVSPHHAGRLVAVQRWSGTRWVTLTWRTLSSTSTASATIKPSVRGYNSYRWYLPAHPDHGSSVSATLKVRVY